MKVIETTAAIYLRKSTENDGKSVAAQERQLRTKADQLGIDIAAVYRNDDGTSASSFSNHNRPRSTGGWSITRLASSRSSWSGV